MQATTRRWASVKPGMYVLGKNEKPWRVEDVRDLRYLLIDRAGTKIIVEPWIAQEVMVLEPTPEEALATVRELLGGIVLYVQENPRHPGYCNVGDNLAEYHLHLSYFHGLWTQNGKGAKSLLRQKEIHAESHEQPSYNHTPHLHRKAVTT